MRGAVADVTDRAALHRAFDEAVAHYGSLDVVFANAGISGGPGFLNQDRTRNADRAIESIPEETIDRLLDVNYKSIFWTIRAAVPHMKRGGGGRIIVTSTISTIKPEIFVGMPYVVSKAGLKQLVRQAALDLAAHKILVNAMAPGPFVTNIGGGGAGILRPAKLHASHGPSRRYSWTRPLSRFTRVGLYHRRTNCSRWRYDAGKRGLKASHQPGDADHD